MGGCPWQQTASRKIFPHYPGAGSALPSPLPFPSFLKHAINITVDFAAIYDGEKCLTFVILEVTDFKSPHNSEKIWVRSASPCLLKTGANKLPAHIYSGKNSLWSDSFYQSGVKSVNTGPRSSYTVFSTEKAKLCQTIVLE